MSVTVSNAQTRTFFWKAKTNNCRGISRNCRSSRTPTRIMTIKIGFSWSSAIPEFFFRYDRETKVHRGPEHYFWNCQAKYRICKMKLIVWTILKIFQDVESVHSGNSHVTSRQVSFTSHRILQRMLRLFFLRRAAEKGRQAFGTHMVFREKFLQIQMRHHQHFIHKNCIDGILPKSRSIRPQWRKVKDQNKIKIWDASQDRQPKIQYSHLQWRGLFKELWGRPTTTADFGSPFWQVPNQQPLLVGR